MLIQLASFLAAVMVILSMPSLEYAMPKVSAELLKPELSAQNVFLTDTATGSILFNKNADEQKPIASITKLMTAIVILDKGLDWSKPIQFESKDKRSGSIPYLIAGEYIMPMDALRLMLVGSSNDAAALLARTTSGSEEKFVQAMNDKAKEIGLRSTIFTDPTGLDLKNVSTAREVAAFTRLALSIPSIREAAQTRKFTFAPIGKENRIVSSTNWLTGSFGYPGFSAFGGKTGHIEESGYNLSLVIGNRKHELVGVVLGSESNESRFNEMKKLLQFGVELVKI